MPFVCNFTSTMEGHEYAMGMFFAIILNKIITNNMWTQICKTTSWENRMLLFFMSHYTNKAWKNLVYGIEEWVHYIFCFFERTNMLELHKSMKKQKYKPKSCSAQLRWLHNKLHGHHLIIIVMQIYFFKGSYGIDMDVIHLFVFFQHWYNVHCLLYA